MKNIGLQTFDTLITSYLKFQQNNNSNNNNTNNNNIDIVMIKTILYLPISFALIPFHQVIFCEAWPEPSYYLGCVGWASIGQIDTGLTSYTIRGRVKSLIRTDRYRSDGRSLVRKFAVVASNICTMNWLYAWLGLSWYIYRDCNTSVIDLWIMLSYRSRSGYYRDLVL